MNCPPKNGNEIKPRFHFLFCSVHFSLIFTDITLSIMSHKVYTPSQIQELQNHPWVLSCTEKYLCFTPVFKEQALDLYMRQYLSPRRVFSQLNLPDFIIYSSLPKNTLKDWKKRFLETWISGLSSKKKWRPKRENPPWLIGKEGTYNELEYLRAKVAYLEEENKAFRLIRAWKYKG